MGTWRGTKLLTGAIAAVVLSGCAVVDDWVRHRVYRARPLEVAVYEARARTAPADGSLSVPVGPPGEVVRVLRVPARLGEASPRRVLYLHGTYRDSLGNLPKVAPMLAAGFDVYLPDYRGWGASSPGLPSEDGIHADARAVWEVLRRETPGDGRWLVYGHSMGGSVAAHLAPALRGDRAVCGLVLESTFPSFERVAEDNLGAWGRWLTRLSRQRMHTAEALRQADVPVWVWHGTADRTISWRLGQEVYQAAPEPRHWETWPLDHSNLQDDPSGRYAQRWRELGERCSSAIKP